MSKLSGFVNCQYVFDYTFLIISNKHTLLTSDLIFT